MHATRSLLPYSSLLTALLLVLYVPFPLLAAPANDHWANATTWVMQSLSTDLTTAGATLEQGEPIGAHGAQMGPSIWYKWECTVDGFLQIDFGSQVFDGVLVEVFSGTTLADLTLEGAGKPKSVSRFKIIPGTQYYFRISGQHANQQGRAYVWLHTEPASAIATNDQPALAKVLNGTTGYLSGDMNGALDHADEPDCLRQALWWKWQCPMTGRYRLHTGARGEDGVRLVVMENGTENGCTAPASVLDFAAIVGTSYLIGVGAQGYPNEPQRPDPVGSLYAYLGPAPMAAAAHETKVAASPWPEVGVLLVGDMAGAVTELGDVAAMGLVFPSRWYFWPVPATGKYSLRGQSDAPVRITVINSVGDEMAATEAEGDTWSMVFTAMASERLLLLVESIGPVAKGKFTAGIFSTPANDEHISPQSLPSSSSASVSFSLLGATFADDEPRTPHTGAADSVWYTWVAPTAGIYTAATRVNEMGVAGNVPDVSVFRIGPENSWHDVERASHSSMNGVSHIVSFMAVMGEKYGFRVAGKRRRSLTAGAGVLMVKVGEQYEPYDAWRWLWSELPPAFSAPGDDPDQDGMSNQVELFQGSNPMVPGAQHLTLSLDSSGGTPVLTARLPRSRYADGNGLGTPLKAQIQWSIDLVNWSSDGIMSPSGTMLAPMIDLSTTDELIQQLPVGTDIPRFFSRFKIEPLAPP